jgi:hypothetical protein
MAIELKDGCLRQIKDGKLKSYPIRPQLTEGMSESIEPESESCKNPEIAKCSQIPTSGTEKNISTGNKRRRGTSPTGKQ